MIRDAWTHFSKVGEALAVIRQKRLYKNEFHNFETYCSGRWGLTASQARRYIAAAEVHAVLAVIPGLPLPECEAQLRPLTAVPPEVAQQAWLTALSWTGEGHVPARLVKKAVKKAIGPPSPGADTSSALRQQRYRTRESIRTGFKELLTLLLTNAARDVLIAKVQELERLLRPILDPKKKRA